MNKERKTWLWTLPALVLLGSLTGLAESSPTGEASRNWTLPEAVTFALENNPDVGISRERLAAAQADFDRARAAYSPVLSVGSRYDATDNPSRAFGSILNQEAFEPGMDFNSPGTIDNWNSHAMVTWPLYDGGRRAGSLEAARAGADSLRAQKEAVRNDIAFGVARAFFEIIQADEVIVALETQLDTQEKTLATAEAQVSRGALLEAEALHIRVDRARVREDLLRSRHAAALARRAFVNLLGLPYSEPKLEPGDAARVVPPSPDVTLLRPELEVAQKSREAAAAEVQVAEAAKRPQVEVFGRVDHDQGWRTDGSGQSWSAGIALRFDLWDGGSASSQTRGARARLREANEAERKVQLALEHEAEQARLGFEEVQQRLEVAREALELARENARLARARFERGALLATQLTEAESSLTSAQVRLAIAETDLAVTTAALRRALGLFPIPLEP